MALSRAGTLKPYMQALKLAMVTEYIIKEHSGADTDL